MNKNSCYPSLLGHLKLYREMSRITDPPPLHACCQYIHFTQAKERVQREQVYAGQIATISCNQGTYFLSHELLQFSMAALQECFFTINCNRSQPSVDGKHLILSKIVMAKWSSAQNDCVFVFYSFECVEATNFCNIQCSWQWTNMLWPFLKTQAVVGRWNCQKSPYLLFGHSQYIKRLRVRKVLKCFFGRK